MAAGTKKAARAVRRKLPLRSAKKKSMLETEKAKATIPKSRVRIKPKIADLPTERQKVVRMQNRIATANKRAKGGQELKLVENKRVRENYIMKIVIPIVNSLTKGGILAWKSPTSNSIANNKKLLSVVKLMEEEVPRSQLHLINLNEKNQDERFQAVIAAFDETGQVLHTHAKKSGDARLWLTKRHAQDLKSLIETDYQQATGLDMTQCKLYISEISLVYGGSAVQTVHNDDDTLDIPNFQQRSGGVGESSTIVYGIKEDKVNRCKIHFAQNNESTNLKMVNVYSGMAVLFSGWVYHAGGDHAGRNASTRLYVDLSKKKRAN